MPYIDVNVTLKLSEQDKDELKSGLGELITLIPGKTEKVLMIRVGDDTTIYFSGEKMQKAAFINVKLFKESEFEAKAEFTKNVFELFEYKLGIQKENIFMSFDEYDTWGSRGALNK